MSLVCNTIDKLDEFPRPLKLLAKTAAKQIDANKIDEILTGILQFLAQLYEVIEQILGQEETAQVIDLQEAKKQLHA